jgi:hypothetical protein
MDQASPKMLTSWSGEGTSDKLVFLAFLSWLVNSCLFLRLVQQLKASATAERVFSFAGLTLSDLRKRLLEGTLEGIMWAKWGSPSIPLGRGDLDITHPELYD